MRVHTLVTSTGKVVKDVIVRLHDVHDACLVLVNEDGHVVVRKARWDLIPQGADITETLASLLARQFSERCTAPRRIDPVVERLMATRDRVLTLKDIEDIAGGFVPGRLSLV